MRARQIWFYFKIYSIYSKNQFFWVCDQIWTQKLFHTNSLIIFQFVPAASNAMVHAVFLWIGDVMDT